jgi:Ca2+-binding RTX toxin-like protein
MPLTAAEQYLLELINRGRLDPLAEAARYGIDLNEGLTPGTIDASAKQVLAPNELLNQAASDHSVWMLENNIFAHDYPNPSYPDGSSDPTIEPGDRMREAGYVFDAPWKWGENLAVMWGGGPIDLDAAIEAHHAGLFDSSGHRKNLMNGSFREIGIGQEAGKYLGLNASMLTEKFAKSGNDVFVTGVVYDDLNGDAFYSIGEGRGGALFSHGAQTVVTYASGGYALKMAPDAAAVVEIAYGDFSGALELDVADGNGKFDYVVGGPVLLSASATLIAGIAHARLLGVDDLSLTGDAAANRLEGNTGDNVLMGGAGNDTLDGGAGADSLDGGEGSDLYLADAVDFIFDSGTHGFDVLRSFSGLDPAIDLAALGIEAVVTDGDDVIDASDWSDGVVVDGGGGNDHLSGGSGNDILVGGGVSGTFDAARYAFMGEDFAAPDAFYLL